MKKCPNCGSEEFFVTAHVTQDWLVNSKGDFMQVENECVEITHQPTDIDLWECADCGYDAAGYEFEVEEEEAKEVKKYTLENYKEFCEKALVCPPFEDEENWQKWIDEHKIQIIANDCIMELDYDADAVNEIEFGLREIHEAILGSGEPTTGNTVGSEYPNATWKDILRFAVWYGFCEDSHDLAVEIQKCIKDFYRDTFMKIMKEIEKQTSYNDELEVNFFKLETKDLWKIFDEDERRKAFKEIICSNVEIGELYDKDGKCCDKVVITDYSIHPHGHLVGWHYGVDWDINSDVNQQYINDYIKEMIGE